MSTAGPLPRCEGPPGGQRSTRSDKRGGDGGDARVARDLVAGLYRQGVMASLVSVVLGAVIIGVMWARIPHATLAVWYTLVLANQVVRIVLMRAFDRVRSTDFDSAPWLRHYTWTMAAGSALFGSVAVVMFPAGDALGQAFLMVMVFGLAAGAMSAHAYYRPALVAHVLLMLLPMILRLALQGGLDYGALLFTMVFGLLAILAFGLRLSGVLNESVALRYQNVELIEELQHKTSQAEAAQLRAEQASLAKSQFFAAASHDLRQPMQALGLFAASLRETRRDPEDTRRVDQILSSVDALESLFDELLDISKLDAGYVKPALTHFAARTLFERLANAYEPLAHKTGLTLHFDHARAVLHSDPVLLERVLGNLISNALRYTLAGSVRVRCDARNGGVAIAVADTGPGIPREEHARIFDEFYQLGNPERDRRKGLGLGLATVKRIALLLSCPVAVDSEPGKGSVFTITVPQGDPQYVVPTPAAPSAADMDALQGKVIAVVDDERDVREGLADLLAQWQCQPVVAGSARELMAKLEATHTRPHAVIADYRLREHETGANAIAGLRRRYGANLPALIMSGDTTPEIFRLVREQGLPLLSKPVRAARLRATLQHLLRGGGEPDPGHAAAP